MGVWRNWKRRHQVDSLDHWLWLHVWRRESILYPASGVRITTRTLLNRWRWKRVDQLPRQQID